MTRQREPFARGDYWPEERPPVTVDYIAAVLAATSPAPWEWNSDGLYAAEEETHESIIFDPTFDEMRARLGGLTADQVLVSEAPRFIAYLLERLAQAERR